MADYWEPSTVGESFKAGGASSRHGHSVTTPAPAPGTPRRKTVEYKILTVSYDYESETLAVTDADIAEPMTFSKAALAELRAAITALGVVGLLLPVGDGVTYR